MAATSTTGAATGATAATTLDTEFKRGLGLYDSTMVVVGSMIGSGIFIVSADMSRRVGSPGWLLIAWIVTGVLTVTAALSYGELAAMMLRRRPARLPAGGVLRPGVSLRVDAVR
jgi:APA family basic amino acid/polyamine antiporter